MRFLLAIAVLLVGCGACARAQDQPIHTLRVFTNLIQIPTLVLDERGLPVEEKTHPKFTVSLDGGKPFPATHVRLEGDDPISLAVLLDARGDEDELLRQMDYELPAMVADGNLRARDHVSIYAMDCGTVRSLADAPAEKAALRAGVDAALRSPELHARRHTTCAAPAALRATLIMLGKMLGELPGRRVILAVSNGVDVSASSWPEVNAVMQHAGITIFGVALSSLTLGASSTRGQTAIVTSTAPPYDAGYEALCATTGGLVLTANDVTLRERLAQILKLIRARYIVQFPRADEMTGGLHLLAVGVVGRNYVVRSAGASLPVADPKLKDDPTVLRVPKDATAPEQ